MTAQTQLVKIAPSAAGLTRDQIVAWTLIRSTPGGVFAEEVGRAVHTANGRHTGDGCCDFCCERGVAVCRTRALRALVIRKRSGKYLPRNPADRAREPMGAIPF